jgi:glutathionyl-hydroquinone reductase
VHALKRLGALVDVSVVHPLWETLGGWAFRSGDMSTEDRANGFQWLHEAYSASCPDYTGKVLVPILWDGVSRRILSNESFEIAAMLNEAFDALGADREADLYPLYLRAQIDALSAEISEKLAKGVYAIADSRNQDEYDASSDRLFALLDALEGRLSDGRAYLLGERATLVDVLAFAPLVRFDGVYNPLFRVTYKRLVDYPRLAAFVGRFYELPRVAETVRLEDILTHYYDGDWAVACRRRIVPRAPAIDWRVSGARHPASSRAGTPAG